MRQVIQQLITQSMQKLLWSALLMLTFSVSVAAQQTLTFREPDSGPMVEFLTDVLEEAYGNLGIQLKYQPLPRLRAEQLADDGQIAGELGRVDGIEERLPSLNKVPFKLYDFSMVLVADCRECGLCTLNNVQNLAYVGGMQAAEDILSEVDLKQPIFRQTEFEQVAKLLRSGRIQAALVPDFQLRNLHLEHPENYAIYRLSSQAGYHYLHDNYQHLIQPLENELRTMQASGRIDELRKQYNLTLPTSLQPIEVPNQLLAVSSIHAGLTNADGTGDLWSLTHQIFDKPIETVTTLASNWPRSRNMMRKNNAQVMVGVRKEQFSNDFIYSDEPMAMDDPLYLFTANAATSQRIINADGETTVCLSGDTYQRQLLPQGVTFYQANTALDCFAMLDLNRVDGVIDYQDSLPDWIEKPYHQHQLSKPEPLFAAFNDSRFGELLKQHFDQAMRNRHPASSASAASE